MTFEERINEALKEAMKAKDEATKRGLREIKAQILLAKTDGSGAEIDEEREIQILQKMAKQRRDSLSIYVEQDRNDLADKEREELAVIERFLPKQLDADELTVILTALIAEVGATSPKDMGKVMGAATKQLAGKADGKLVAEIVKKLLQ
ncbi:GatB/YqeY domain-containing protein [Haliscomenobacter sp.]|uniref:GatB/YqeY domain-containing protein n=1 Tax=Haliscomenobacter sp. TaxID=2717303 RepID=UPI00336520CB